MNDDSFSEGTFNFTGEIKEMLYEDIFNARRLEAGAIRQTVDQRIAWDQISRVERLESALRAAKVRLPWNNPGMTVQAN